ncbi:toprim domain-containing protein [soil metagenome]
MKTKEQIEQLKAISILHYLSIEGFQPVQTKGVEQVYYSPKYEEHTPSFFVNVQKNVFHDFSGQGEQGDIIRLVQYLKGCNFMQAIEMLEAIKPEETQSFSFSGQKPSQTEQHSTVKIVSVQPLRNRSLIDYVASRKISHTIASIYLQEIHYQIEQKQYYAAGFANDKGGFELRSLYFKGGTSPKWFTHFPVDGSTAINLFEGVFDFLSCCQFFNVQRLNNPTVILNSLSVINDVIPTLSRYKTVNTFLDNDKSGKRALERLSKEGLNIIDCSHYYPSHKDFNEFLVNQL